MSDRDKYEKFMIESNTIEGENRLNPGDMDAMEATLAGIRGVNDLLAIHNLLGAYLQKDWVGKIRTVDVVVGTYHPPPFEDISKLLGEYIQKFNKMGSWEAHNEFEKIHPFRDLNGRVGRLIWLSKAVNEGYDFTIPFLQMYYYQTLVNYEQGGS